jgi:PAT family beta-lactamase induction signal transducer AmpG
MSAAPPFESSAAAPLRMRLRAAWRMLVVIVLGFASGLPLALTGQAMQAWLSMEGLGVATIGFLSLVGLPYTFKFLWAPLLDRFDLPWLGRRRGWMVLTQLLLALALVAMASVSPSAATRTFALLAVLVALVSATQDVVVDAYRTDLLPAHERGLGSSFYVLGYRLAMIVSGSLAMIWTDTTQGGGWAWPDVYRFMAGVMVAAAVFSAVALPRLPAPQVPHSAARRDLLGFLAVMAAMVVGVLVTDRLLVPVAHRVLGPLLGSTSLAVPLQARWMDLAALLGGIAFTLPLAVWAARRARFETLIHGLSSYFSQAGALPFLAFIVLYKLGDAFAGSLMTPFLLQTMAFSQAEVGVVNKLVGMWVNIAGALLGGLLMFRLGLWRALLAFGVLQMVSNLGFWWLVLQGKNMLPGFTLPAFDWGFVWLVQDTPMDGGLLLVIVIENLSGGMGTAAFMALLMGLCNQRFTATQFALLSAFASVGRVWVGPLAGVLAESIGWPAFFVLSTIAALPALLLLVWLRAAVEALDVQAPPAGADD